MRIRSLAGWAAAAVLAVPAAALAAPDTPDPGFGTNGVVVTGFPGRTAAAVGMILDRAGRPVVVAQTGPMELGIRRFGPGGADDPTFAAGLRSLGVAGDSRLAELVEYGDGYVAGGWIEATPGDRRFALVRWDGVGTPDAGFVVRDRLDAGDDEIGALAVDPQQRIVAAGRAGARIGVARYGSNGVRDAAFSGVRDFPGLSGEEASGVVLEPTGRVLLAGTGAVPGGERRFVLAALTPAGTIDATFGAGGAATLDVGEGNPQVRAMVRQPDGKLLVGGTTDPGAAGGGLVARFLPDGAPDTTFSSDGIARVGLAGAVVEDVALQPDGKIAAVGTAGGDSFFARFRPGGVRDPGFGIDGVVRQSLGPAGADGLTGTGIGTAGRIVGGGLASGAVVLSALTGGDTSDPALAMTADGLGDLVTFTISATNRGVDPARDVRVDVAPPPGLTARAITMPGGSCGGTSCALGNLPVGATARVTLLARAKSPGPLPASAVVSASTFDANPANNAASFTGTARRNRVVRRDRTKPVVKLRLPARRIGQVRRLLRLRVTTSEAASVRLTARTKTIKRLVRARRVAVAKKGTHKITLKLTAAGRKAARKKRPRRMAVVVTVRATDRAGNTGVGTLRKTLRR